MEKYSHSISCLFALYGKSFWQGNDLHLLGLMKQLRKGSGIQLNLCELCYDDGLEFVNYILTWILWTFCQKLLLHVSRIWKWMQLQSDTIVNCDQHDILGDETFFWEASEQLNLMSFLPYPHCVSFLVIEINHKSRFLSKCHHQSLL